MRWINAVWAWPFRFAMYFGPVALALWCAWRINSDLGGFALGVWMYVEARSLWK